jgi:hypothetical protein
MAKSRGKYANVIDKLPRTFGTEPEYQQKVNAVKLQILEPAKEGEVPLTSETIIEWVKDVNKDLIEFGKMLVRATAGRNWGSEHTRVYRDLRIIKEQLEAHVSNIDLLIAAYSQLMAEQYEVEGVSSMRLDDDGSTVRVQYEPHASVNDRDAFRDWCIEEGLIRQLALPWPTTNKIVKDRLLAGEQEPPGVEAKSRVKFVLTKG